ncbi:hypothetical protein PSJM300_10505 [Stutzerimonas stutzeri DSM 10701]|nr:hypothetical protein PSJM300_10505 [Stutzerimonas stutzeri DSM 10701]
MGIETLIAEEMKRREAFLKAQGSLRQRLAISMKELNMPAPPQVSTEVVAVPPRFISAALSAATCRKIGAAYGAAQGQQALADLPVTDAGVKEARNYVSELMEVDLSDVIVEVIPQSTWRDASAEGLHFEAGATQHVIVMPSHVASPVEVLVHEFGHAAHSTRQRQNSEFPFYFTAAATAELIAHYCQYSFIVGNLSEHHLLIALGQLVTAGYALSIQASGAKTFQQYIASPESMEFRKGMPLSALQNTHLDFCQNPPYYFSQVNRGVALILALLLLDENSGMKQFASLDRFDRSLEEKLANAFPNQDCLIDFARINERISELAQRCRIR